MKVTTYNMLSFDDCELMLRDDIASKCYYSESDGKQYCIILLSEIPLEVEEITFGDFSIRTLHRDKPEFFKPYPLFLYLPTKFDFLTSPLVGEVVAAILSFSLRRRIKAYRRSITPSEAEKGQLQEEIFIYLPCISVGPELSLQQPLTLNEQEKRISTFNFIYNKLMRMKKEDYLSTVRSLHLYQLALLTYREDVGLAYTLLVASIETMAQQFIKKSNFDVSFDMLRDAEGWAKFFVKERLTDELQEKIKKKLIKRESFLSLKFRQFIIDNLPESFWTAPDSRAKEFDEYVNDIKSRYFGEEHVKENHEHFERYWWLYDPHRRIPKEELAEVLKNIYELRSKFTHAGESPPAEVTDLYETAELKPKISVEKARVEFVRALPSFFWFERVVHESIVKFLQNETPK